MEKFYFNSDSQQLHVDHAAMQRRYIIIVDIYIHALTVTVTRLRVTVILIVIIIFLVCHALDCYKCTGADTNSCKSGSQTCPPSYDRCVKYVLEVGGKEAVVANCSTSTSCSHGALACSLIEASNPLITECDSYCCDSDNCNHSPKASQIFFGVLVLGVFAAMFLQ
jgi:hypothetical protein